MQKGGEENMKMGKSSLETRPKIWGLLGETRQVTLFLNFADEFKFHDTHTSKISVSKNQMPQMPSYLHQEILLKLMLQKVWSEQSDNVFEIIQKMSQILEFSRQKIIDFWRTWISGEKIPKSGKSRAFFSTEKSA